MSDDQITGPGGAPSGREQDCPARLLALIAGLTSTGRGDWGRAMLAELDQVSGERARWRFAFGSARAMATPLLAGQLGLLALAAAILGFAIDPGIVPTEVVLLPGAVCLSAWAAAAEPAARPAVSPASRIGQVIVIAAIGACLVLAVRMLTLYPVQAGSARETWVAAVILITFCVELVTYALLAVRRCDPLGAWRGSGVPGLAAALAVGVVFQVSQPPGGLSSDLAYPTVTPVLVATALAAPIVAGALGGVLDRGGHGLRQRLRSGAGEMVWGWLLCAPAVFIASVLGTPRSAIAAEAAEPVISVEARQQGAVSVLAWVSRDDLGGAILMFTVLATSGLLIFLVIHALAKAAGRDRRSAVTRLAAEPPAS